MRSNITTLLRPLQNDLISALPFWHPLSSSHLISACSQIISALLQPKRIAPKLADLGTKVWDLFQCGAVPSTFRPSRACLATTARQTFPIHLPRRGLCCKTKHFARPLPLKNAFRPRVEDFFALLWEFFDVRLPGFTSNRNSVGCDDGGCDTGGCDSYGCDSGGCDGGGCDSGGCDCGGCDGGCANGGLVIMVLTFEYPNTEV